MNRREFIRTSSAASLAYSSLPLLSSLSRVAPYRVALVGAGWWGVNILRCAVQSGQSKVVALCDVDQNQLKTAAAELRKLTPDQPKHYRDYRELLAKEKPEIVIVATPDHWHPLCCIAAIEAGAHVYVEKPIGHTILEGRAMVNAARKHERVVQVGTHRRISPHNISGREFLRSGKAGKIGMVRAFVHYGGGEGQVVPDTPVPEGLDWEMWCGPAPLRAYNKLLHPKGFRGFLDYANGTLGDWGIHWMDQILWVTDRKHPRKIFSTGGRSIRRDNTEAPDHQVAVWQFDDDFTVEWEHRQFGANRAEKTHPQQAVGCYFYGTEGTFHMGWLDGWTFYPANANLPTLHEDAKLNNPDQQNIAELWDDFLKAIQAKTRPVSDIEEGHRSTTMALLGMLSYKLGRSIDWDGEKERILNDPEANALLRRSYRGEWQYPKA